MHFDAVTYMALAGAVSVLVVTIGIFAFVLTRRGK